MAQGYFGFKVFERLDVIFREGDIADCAYIIERGKVAIMIKTASGKPRVLATLKKNDLFGEMALIDNEPCSVTAVALENCEVTIITKRTME